MNKTKQSFYNGSTILFLIIGFINAMGMGVIQMYSLIYVYAMTHANFYVSLQEALAFGSCVLAGYLYVLHRKNYTILGSMVGSEIVRLGAAIFIALYQTITSMYLSVIMIYVAHSFFRPSYQVALAYIADGNITKRLNALTSILYSLALVSSWLIAPWCFNLFSYGGVFFLVALMHLANIIMLLLLGQQWRHLFRLMEHDPANISTKKTFSFRGNLRAMFRRLRKHELLFYLLILVASINVAKAAIDALEVGLFRTIYNFSDYLIGFSFGAWIMGGVVAGVLVQYLLPRISGNSFPVLWINILLFALAALLFVNLSNQYLGITIYAICGFLYILFDILSNNTIYDGLDKQQQSNGFGLKNMVINGVMLLCLPLFGYLADTTSLVLVISGAVTVSIMLLAMISRLWIKNISLGSNVIYGFSKASHGRDKKYGTDT